MPESQFPRTAEEFRIWMVQKVGEIHTSQAAMAGDLRVAVAEHGSLRERVTAMEKENQTAKYWENGKILGLLLIQAAGKYFRL